MNLNTQSEILNNVKISIKIISKLGNQEMSAKGQHIIPLGTEYLKY